MIRLARRNKISGDGVAKEYILWKYNQENGNFNSENESIIWLFSFVKSHSAISQEYSKQRKQWFWDSNYKIQCYLGNCWPCLPGNERSDLHYTSCPGFLILHITFSSVQTICRAWTPYLTPLPGIPQILMADPNFLPPVNPLSLPN